MTGWLGRLFGRREAGAAWIEAGDLRDRLGRGEHPLILDVRGPDEFDGPLGHIDGPRNVPLRNCCAISRQSIGKPAR